MDDPGDPPIDVVRCDGPINQIPRDGPLVFSDGEHTQRLDPRYHGEQYRQLQVGSPNSLAPAQRSRQVHDPRRTLTKRRR
jgi:hypothetical protein